MKSLEVLICVQKDSRKVRKETIFCIIVFTVLLHNDHDLTMDY